MRTWMWGTGLAATLAVLGCTSKPPQTTGGTSITAGPFGRGVVVAGTDYQSSNLSLLGVDGAVLSTVFASSSTTGMSWDVALPSMKGAGDDVVYLDRTYSLLTWLDVRTAKIRAQFHVDGDDLGRNPWDYLPISADKAYVTRYDRSPGKSEHGDVIVVNPVAATVTSPVAQRIPIADALTLPEGGYSVHPARGVVIGDRAYVTTVIATLDYAYTDSQIVEIDTTKDEVVAATPLTGLHDCTGIAASPDGAELAVSCSGDLTANGDPALGTAGVALLKREGLSVNKVYPGSALGAGVPGFALSYAADRTLVVTLLGNVKNGIDDVAIALDLDSGQTKEIHRAGPVQIGAVLCPPRIDGATDKAPEACFVTDADSFATLRFPVNQGVLGDPTSTEVDDGRGHPPRYLGQF